jgi:carbonic anhydrase
VLHLDNQHKIKFNMIPEEALARLKEGNQRFLQNCPVEHDWLTRVKQTADGQYPFVSVLGCIDSRTSTELIFDLDIGDLFSIRVAGNIIDDDVLASLEFACTQTDARLIVVMGHTRCGAVAGACADTRIEEGYLEQLLDKIRPAVKEARQKCGADASEDVVRDEISRINTLHSVALIKEKSSIIAGLCQKNEVIIAAALYDVKTGTVTFYDEDKAAFI